MKGLLFSQMQPPDGQEADFHDWYETEHIPARMVLPGFASATRYRTEEGSPDYLACYVLDDLAGLTTPEYQRLKQSPSERTARMLGSVSSFTRYTCTQISDTGETGAPSAMTMVVAFAVPDGEAAEFDDWYEQEHVPLLMQADGWQRVHRYRTQPGGDGPPWTHLALHELVDRSSLDAPERVQARTTAWRDQLATRPWFDGSGRWLYRPIHHAVAEAAR